MPTPGPKAPVTEPIHSPVPAGDPPPPPNEVPIHPSIPAGDPPAPKPQPVTPPEPTPKEPLVPPGPNPADPPTGPPPAAPEPSPHPQGPEPAVRRRMALAFVALSPVWLYVFYLFFANAALMGGIVERAVNGATPDLQMQVGSAWTVRPFRFEVRDTTVRFEDKNVQFYLSVPKGTIDLDVAALRTQTFHLSRVRATGVGYYFRHRVVHPEDPVVARRLASYPKIPGFDPVPFYPIGAPPPPLTEAEYNLWTVWLEDVDADAQELWFLEYRYQGPARAFGSFKLKPVRRLSVAAGLELQGGGLSIDPLGIADDVRGKVAVDVPDFDVNEPQGLDVLQKVDTRIDASLHLTRLPFDVYGVPGVSLAKDGASMEMALGIRKGALEPASVMKFAGAVGYATPGFAIEGPLAAVMSVPTKGAVDLAADVPTGKATLGKEAEAKSESRSRKKTTATFHKAAFRAAFTAKDLAADPAFNGAKARVEAIDVPDLGFLDSTVARGGRLHGSFEATVSPAMAVRSQLKASATDLEIVFSDMVARGAGSFVGSYVSSSPAGGGALEDLKLEMPAVAVDFPKAGRKTTWVTVTATRMAWQGATPHTLDGAFHVRGGNGGIFSGFAEKKGGIGGFSARKLLDDNAFEGDLVVKHLPWATRVEVMRAACGSLVAEGGVIMKGDETSGAFLLNMAGVNVAAELSPTTLTIEPFRSHDWLGRRLKALDIRP